jgi:glycosyltransferase 2 family protein
MIGSIFPVRHKGRGIIRSFDWKLAFASLKHLNWGWLLLSVLFILATYYGRALRWMVFLKPLKAKPRLANVFSATVIGFSAVTLFGRPGEFVRPYLIAMKEGVPVASQIAAWILERIFDLLMALLVFGFALSHLAAAGLHGGSKLAWIFATGGRAVWVCSVAILVALVFLRHFAEAFEQFLLARLGFLAPVRLKKVALFTGSLVRGVESARSDAALLSILFYSIIEWALIAACYWCLVQAFSGVFSLTFVDILVLMGFVSFGAVVQIPGIGGGVQVVAVLVLTELFGIRLELATSFAMFIWILNFVVIVPIGLVFAFKEGLDWRSFRRLGREASA